MSIIGAALTFGALVLALLVVLAGLIYAWFVHGGRSPFVLLGAAVIAGLLTGTFWYPISLAQATNDPGTNFFTDMWYGTYFLMPHFWVVALTAGVLLGGILLAAEADKPGPMGFRWVLIYIATMLVASFLAILPIASADPLDPIRILKGEVTSDDRPRPAVASKSPCNGATVARYREIVLAAPVETKDLRTWVEMDTEASVLLNRIYGLADNGDQLPGDPPDCLPALPTAGFNYAPVANQGGLNISLDATLVQDGTQMQDGEGSPERLLVQYRIDDPANNFAGLITADYLGKGRHYTTYEYGSPGDKEIDQLVTDMFFQRAEFPKRTRPLSR